MHVLENIEGFDCPKRFVFERQEFRASSDEGWKRLSRNVYVHADCPTRNGPENPSPDPNIQVRSCRIRCLGSDFPYSHEPERPILVALWKHLELR